MEVAQRRNNFILGVACAFAPLVLLIVSPRAVPIRFALALRIEPQLFMGWCFIVGLASEVVAAWLFSHSCKRPWDWLSACALAMVVFSCLAVIVFWGALSIFAMQGW